MNYIILRIIIFISFMLALPGSIRANTERPLIVFGAASTAGPLLKISTRYKAETGAEIKFSFASSGTLARQIEQGARADIYISASKKWANYANAKGLLVKSTKEGFLNNSLVLICPKNSTINLTGKSLETLKNFKGKIAIGNPLHVPAGAYAKEALVNLDLWNNLKKQFIMAKDVRNALRIVELAEAELGIVYGSDAKKSTKVRVIKTLPASSHSPIVYVIAKCTGGSDKATNFIKFLSTPVAKKIFTEYGFSPKNR